jgi:hypothetical protein
LPLLFRFTYFVYRKLRKYFFSSSVAIFRNLALI